MTKRCVFCGENLGFFSQDCLTCGNTKQFVCQECKKKYGVLSMRERVQYLLDFGHPEEPERLREYLSTPEERAQKAREAKKSGLTCLRCGGEMLKYGRHSFPLGDEGLFGTVLREGWMTSWMEMDILRCERCGRAEFFLPNPPLEENPNLVEEMVVCPVCGTEHSSLSGCPTCALNRARGGRRTDAKTEKGQKPPWEK